jgi:hypothetical protein
MQRALGLAYAGNRMRIVVAKRVAQGAIRTYISDGYDPIEDPSFAVAVLAVSVSATLRQRSRGLADLITADLEADGWGFSAAALLSIEVSSANSVSFPGADPHIRMMGGGVSWGQSFLSRLGLWSNCSGTSRIPVQMDSRKEIFARVRSWSFIVKP